MEKRTIYRVTGILAIVGLVVVLLPLFMDNEETPTLSPAVIQAPAFPEQAATGQPQTTANPEPEITQNVVPPTDSMRESNQVTASAATVSQDSETITESRVVPPPTPVTPPKESGVIPIIKQPDAEISSNEPAHPTEEASAQSTNKAAVTKLIAHKEAPIVKKTETTKREIKQALHMRPMQALPKSTTGQGLLQLKRSAWVIQIGSFKNKANAIKMANHLRANGYRAFMQDMTSAYGSANTRVFIGPEYKHASALALAKQLESNLHVHGIVISYNPLVL